ncbi:hypothetical protein A6F57_19745 [Alteromonas stellipolaris]|uniref:hypothetical protein n=1 Tax=Alteromonas stellipolaris TaxID=233316 RepID=UPI0007B43EAE|nr:hypothetical protein [Alteromonas stellipolaris]ANB27215.1 hypothetical protein A6F57_19745 [Alteromonas stellipolaris]
MTDVNQDTSETETLLNEWGKWARMGLGLNIGRGDSNNVYFINDDMALLIDRLVAELKRDRPLLASIVVMYYRSDYNYPMLANALKIGETKARSLHKSAICWIDGALVGFTLEVNIA